MASHAIPTVPLPRVLHTADLCPVLKDILAVLLAHQRRLDESARTIVLGKTGQGWSLKVTTELRLEG